MCSFHRLHHPASSCSDNREGDSELGGAAVVEEKGLVRDCFWDGVGTKGGVRCQLIDPSNSLHLRKWILLSVTSAAGEKTSL